MSTFPSCVGPARRRRIATTHIWLMLIAAGAMLLAACGAKAPATQDSPGPPASPTASNIATRGSASDASSPAGSIQHQSQKTQGGATFASAVCPSTPLRGVYHPYRLHVLKTCQWFVGTVERVIHEADGDYHVDVAPATGYASFLDTDNHSAQHGQLVTEIMPGQKLPIPSVGERVSVFGTWVLDADHGWNEIHPIWAITYGDGKTVDALPPEAPRFDPAGSDDGGSGGSASGGGGGGNCDPNYVGACLKDGIGDYDCYGGAGNGPNFTPPGVTIRVVGTDVFDLDADHDGLACE